MDAGPWTSLGTAGWFISVWIAMISAMMLPSAWPTVALYSRMGETRLRGGPALFAAAYLATWTVFGAFALVVAALSHRVAGDFFAWDRAGRWAAGAALILAAVYELTPLKSACLNACRSPFSSLVDSWSTGAKGAVGLGARHSAWCVGCCWALMVSLFALGVMSLVWSVLIAIVIACQKMLARRRVATYATASLLTTLGVLVLATPGLLPALTVPSPGA